MLTTNTQRYQTAYPQDGDYKNPFRDRLEGFEFLEVHQRLERYTDTYDNTEYDSNPAVGVIDVFDSSGDASVGRNMNFHGDRQAGIYSEKRFNSNAAGDIFGVTQLSFRQVDGKIVATQSADRDGDNYEEFHRQSVINPTTQQIESVTER